MRRACLLLPSRSRTSVLTLALRSPSRSHASGRLQPCRRSSGMVGLSRMRFKIPGTPHSLRKRKTETKSLLGLGLQHLHEEALLLPVLCCGDLLHDGLAERNERVVLCLLRLFLCFREGHSRRRRWRLRVKRLGSGCGHRGDDGDSIRPHERNRR